MKALAGSEEKFQNERQELIEGCRKGDQKSQFQISCAKHKTLSQYGS